MTTLTTKATYKNGVVIPKRKPLKRPDEVLVTYRFRTVSGVSLGNASVILAILDKHAGILPKKFPSGTVYISKLRKKLAKDWEKRFER